jgi:transcription elongation factor Elf1
MFGWLMVEAQAKSKRIQKKIQKFRSIIDFAKSKSDYERQYCAVCGSTNIVPLTKETKSIDLITHLCGEPVSCEVDTGDYAWNNE